MPERHDRSCPASTERLLELYFLEHRAKLIDLAAFLDRLDRASDSPAAHKDFRLRALRTALEALLEDSPARAERIQNILSDPTTQPIESAAGLKAAHGAYPGKT